MKKYILNGSPIIIYITLTKIQVKYLPVFAQKKNHSCNLDYYCKDHNKLCCAKCITKLKNKEIGQHTYCNIYFIADIKNEKKLNYKKI